MTTKLLAVGQGASPGRASGPLALSADAVRAFGGRGTPAIFVRAEMDADDMPAVRVAAGVVTTRGGITGDGAVAARVLGMPCLVGMSTVAIRSDRTALLVSTPEGEVVVAEGEIVSIVVEGARGELSLGVID